MTTYEPQFGVYRQSRSMQLREAVLGCFYLEVGASLLRLASFAEQDWRRNYKWMDASGLALYLLDRLIEIRHQDVLPAPVLARFKKNAVDNAVRTRALFAEATRIKSGFAHAGIRFAVLKGFTLSPESVARPTLRCQLDLDFLVTEADALAAGEVLRGEGYKLDVVSGDTWEFKAGAAQVASINDLYKTKPQRSAELHLIQDHALCVRSDGRLARAEVRLFEGEPFPALSPPDLFLGQALHLYSHVSSPFTRASWLLEFRRHVLARIEDSAFWSATAALAADQPEARFAIGLVTMLAEECFGSFAPQPLRSWTADQLGLAVQLWVSNYGRFCVLADFPGTKLYLLLQNALGNKAQLEPEDILKRLLPLRQPRMISFGGSRDGLAMSLRRSRVQAAFFLSRLRFHSVEGLRYSIEYLRWRRKMSGVCR